MSAIGDKLNRLEELNTLNSSYKYQLALAFRHYENYRLGESASLHKALHTAVTGYRQSESCVELLLACAFLHIETGNGESADRLLDNFKNYRTYYKNNNPFIFAIYTYITAVYDIEILNKTNAKRQIKQLNELKEKDDGKYIDLFLGDIYYRLEDYGRCFEFIEDAFENGCRSYLIYILYNDMYNAGAADETGYLLVPFMKWSIAQGLNITDFIFENMELIDDLFDEYVNEFIDIYKEVDSDIILELICAYGAETGNITKEFFGFYTLAEHRQMKIERLPEVVVRSSFLYGNEDLSVYTVGMFLSETELDTEIMPYIFHLLLSYPKFAKLIETYELKPKILQYGAFALNAGLSGYMYNSIYKYMLLNTEGNPSVEEKLAAIIYEQLFKFEISFESIEQGTLYIYESEKKNVKTYEFSEGKAVISSACGNIKPVVIDGVTKSVADVKYSIRRVVSNVDCRLYEYFIERGYGEPDMFIALSKLYIECKEADEKHILVLNRTLELSSISSYFRTQVDAALGNILSMLQLHDEAAEYFEKVDESRLNDRYIEIMLNAFINAGDFKRAAVLIVKKREYISDRALLSALKQMVKDKDVHSLIADAAFELIIKNWYDTRLLDIVTKHYAGGIEDWFMLRRSLSQINVFDIALDKKILEHALWIHDFSENSQLVFHRLFRTEPESELVENYLYYACYEILSAGKRPEYETIGDLEKIYTKTSDKLIAYALSKVYLSFNITTLKSEEILAETVKLMEYDNILIEEFKQAKDKALKTTYIEKNQPFIYKTGANKKVILYYKIDKAKEYEKLEMKHFVFGIFVAVLPLFYNEEINYFISEEMATGSISTSEKKISNHTVNLKPQAADLYFQINNALIYEQMFKYDEAEKIITGLIQSGPKIRGGII